MQADYKYANELFADVQNGDAEAIEYAQNMELRKAEGPYKSFIQQITDIFAGAKELASKNKIDTENKFEDKSKDKQTF